MSCSQYSYGQIALIGDDNQNKNEMLDGYRNLSLEMKKINLFETLGNSSRNVNTCMDKWITFLGVIGDGLHIFDFGVNLTIGVNSLVRTTGLRPI